MTRGAKKEARTTEKNGEGRTITSWPAPASPPDLIRPSTHLLPFWSLHANNRSMHGGWVYIMTNRPSGTLYVGVTGDLARRVLEHREGMVDGFTKKHGLKRLVYA